jgi:hypothetical protein
LTLNLPNGGKCLQDRISFMATVGMISRMHRIGSASLSTVPSVSVGITVVLEKLPSVSSRKDEDSCFHRAKPHQ